MKRGRRPAAAFYMLDTNIYVRAFRDAEFGERLRTWQRALATRILFSVVVLHELLVGAADAGRRAAVERNYAQPFRRSGRLIAPSMWVWLRAAESDRVLRTQRRYAEKLAQRSFANDLLLALSCREIGAVLVTENTDD